MEKNVYKYRLHGIDLVEKNLFRGEVLENEELNFDIKAQSLIDSNRKLVIVVIEITIAKKLERQTMAKFMAAFGYEVEEFEELFKSSKNNSFAMPLDLETLLKSISVSTMRGIIFSELRGTVLHKAILPVIMMDSFKPIEKNIIENPHVSV